MSHTSNQANGDLVREFLLIADLLEEPRLAQLYPISRFRRYWYPNGVRDLR
jgi:hypothetical protein